MTNHTTFETSRILAESGFPQPEPKSGQTWYLFNEQDPILAIPHQDHGRAIYFNADHILGSLDGVCEINEFPINRIFAPTASDILNQLGAISLIKNPILGTWTCKVKVMGFKGQNRGKFHSVEFEHESEVEGCAKAWLSLNK